MRADIASTTAQSNLQTLSRSEFWLHHVQQWRDSQMSKMAYCKQHALAYHQLIYWSSKSDNTDVNQSNVSSDSGFVAVSVSPMATNIGLCVRLPNGISIEGVDEHSADWVSKLVRQL